MIVVLRYCAESAGAMLAQAELARLAVPTRANRIARNLPAGGAALQLAQQLFGSRSRRTSTHHAHAVAVAFIGENGPAMPPILPSLTLIGQLLDPARLAELNRAKLGDHNGTRRVAPLAGWISRYGPTPRIGDAARPLRIGVPAHHCREDLSRRGGNRVRAPSSSSLSCAELGVCADQGDQGLHHLGQVVGGMLVAMPRQCRCSAFEATRKGSRAWQHRWASSGRRRNRPAKSDGIVLISSRQALVGDRASRISVSAQFAARRIVNRPSEVAVALRSGVRWRRSAHPHPRRQ